MRQCTWEIVTNICRIGVKNYKQVLVLAAIFREPSQFFQGAKHGRFTIAPPPTVFIQEKSPRCDNGDQQNSYTLCLRIKIPYILAVI